MGPPARPQPAWPRAPGRPPPPRRLVPGMDLPDRRPDVDAVAELGSQHDTHRRVDRGRPSARVPPPAPQLARPISSASTLGERPRRCRRRRRHDQGRAWEDRPRVVDHARIAPLRLHHQTEPLERGPVVQARSRARERPSEDGSPSSPRAPPRRTRPQARAVGRRCPPRSTVHGLDDVQRVADRVSERLGHVASRRRARAGRSRARAPGRRARAPRPARWSS